MGDLHEMSDEGVARGQLPAVEPSASSSAVTAQLEALHVSCKARDAASFTAQAEAFVREWQSQRAKMETDDSFVDARLMAAFVTLMDDSACASSGLVWYSLKMSCLLARSDPNTRALLDAGGVAATLNLLSSAAEAEVEVALALLQNVAYSPDGVAAILAESGVCAVLHAMRAHVESAPIQKNGLGVLWNLCDSDDHWVAFLREGVTLVSVLLATLAHHPDEAGIEESVLDSAPRPARRPAPHAAPPRTPPRPTRHPAPHGA